MNCDKNKENKTASYKGITITKGRGGLGVNGNLIPITARPKEEARLISSMGGIAAANKRREKKAAREVARLILESDIPLTEDTAQARELLDGMGLEASERNMQAMMILGQIMAGAQGKHQAAQLVLSLIGEIKTGNINILETESHKNETYINRQYIEASLDFWTFCHLKVPNIYTKEAKYLKVMCKKLQNFMDDFDEEGEQIAIFNLPPGHGKTLTARLFGEWVLGRDRTKKIMAVAYNHDFATDFSKAVRDGINEEKIDENVPVFGDIFCDVKVEKGSGLARKWKLENSPEYNFLAVSPGSAATGYRAHLVLIDDVIKGAYEAFHHKHLDDLWNWFSNTLYSRREKGRKIAIFSTRWALKDLSGRLVENCHTHNKTYSLMTRQAFDGETMLNEALLTRAEYDDIRTVLGEEIFEANYNQKPIDLKGRLYSEFLTYTEKPKFTRIEAICDTADEGKDYLCNIIFGITTGLEPDFYILDVYYTQDSMESTERELVRRLIDFEVSKLTMETNFGGKGWKKVIETLYNKSGGSTCSFHTFTQTRNKEARILAAASTVTRKILMPALWETRFPLFYRHITEFQRVGASHSQPDDALDVLTLIVERGHKNKNFIGI